MQPINFAEEARLGKEMADACDAWQQASKEVRGAMELFPDFHENSYRKLKLRKARQNEASAIQRYRKAVEAYAKAIGSDWYRP